VTPVSAVQIQGADVHCESVVYIYSMPEGDVVALRGVDLDIDAGESVALLGPSGSGKSTLLSLLAGLIRPSGGVIRIADRDVGRMTSRELIGFRSSVVSLVLQSASLNLLPYATVLENVQFAQAGSGRTRDTVLFKPLDLLSELGLTGISKQPAATLSGGDQKVVALAMAIATNPRLLLVDEPSSDLDPKSRNDVMQTLARFNAEFGTTLLIVTHDPAIASAVPRSLTIRDGRVGTEGRRGEEFAVIGRDGSLQLPPDVLESLPPGTLLRVHRRQGGVDLTRA
jgi:putative ABC transport system ATP-binding protein